MPRVFKSPDYLLLGIITMLLVLGILTLANISAFVSQKALGNTYYYLKHQLLYGVLIGLALGLILYFLPLSFIRKWSPLALFLNLVGLFLVFIPGVGVGAQGATRWIDLGPFTFQPAEFLKLTFILYLATWLASRTEKISGMKESFNSPKKKEFSQTLFAFLFIVFLIGTMMILQPNISTMVIIFIIGAVMYFVAGMPTWHFLLMGAAGMGVVLLLILKGGYRMKRFIVFLNPEIDPMGMSYQLQQAKIAIGSGGLLGLGLGMSRQKFGFLPTPMSDSIFAIFAEETGFIGAFCLLLLFFFFAWKGFHLAKESRDRFSRLTAFGITFWIIFQSFVNIGAMIGILPLTGVPLPFFSYGSSALISELMAMGILLNISKYASKPK